MEDRLVHNMALNYAYNKGAFSEAVVEAFEEGHYQASRHSKKELINIVKDKVEEELILRRISSPITTNNFDTLVEKLNEVYSLLNELEQDK